MTYVFHSECQREAQQKIVELADVLQHGYNDGTAAANQLFKQLLHHFVPLYCSDNSEWKLGYSQGLEDRLMQLQREVDGAEQPVFEFHISFGDRTRRFPQTNIRG